MSLSPESIRYQEAHITDNSQPNLIISTAICLTAAYIAVILRFVSRRIGGVIFGKDDVAIIIALVWLSPACPWLSDLLTRTSFLDSGFRIFFADYYKWANPRKLLSFSIS